MIDDNNSSEPRSLPPPRQRWGASGGVLGTTALAVVLIAGAALGAGGTRLAQNWEARSVLLLQPAPIDKMTDQAPVAIKGEVSDVFGQKFVIQDPSGRALVDTGPEGDGRTVVTRGEAVTVQGRFDRGVVRAEVLVHADGRNESFGPPPPPPPGGPDPRADRGPPPPPPPGGPDPRADRGPPPPPPPGGPDPRADRGPPPPPPPR